jgi:hypothetical protein
VCVDDPTTSVVREKRSLSENLSQSSDILGGVQNNRGKMNKLAIFGGTGMTGRVAVAYALEKGKLRLKLRKKILENSLTKFSQGNLLSLTYLNDNNFFTRQTC